MNPEALIGVELGNSVVQRLLGQGTMGAVYLATRADRQVALKVFLPASPLAEADNEAFLRRLEETIARSASLDHPHILTVLNHGRHEQLVFQIMPYIASANLEALLARAQLLPFIQIQHYLEQLASALDYAHSRGLLHGDIKASNILVGSTGDVWLSDFGLASLTIEQNFASTRRAVPGMLNTIAPEYVLSQAVDQRADVYALGVVLYQMVTGIPPFQGNSLGEVAMMHVRVAPPPPTTLRTDLPPAVEQVMLRALAKRPTERYTHARDLATAFRLALEAAQPAPTDNAPTHAFSLLNELASSAQPVAEQAPAPRAGGLFDPRWRTQAPSPGTSGVNIPPTPAAEQIPQASMNSFEDTALTPFGPTNIPTDEQPTNPVPQLHLSSGDGAEQAPLTTRTFPPVQESFPTTEFSPAADSAGTMIKRTGLLSMARLQASAQSQSSPEASARGTLQLANIPTGNTEELGKFASQLEASPTSMLSMLARLPSNGDATGTVKLTESVKIVQVPVAGQPGRFMTGYLPLQPVEQPAPSAPKRLNTRMKIISLVLAIVIIATGSGIFLATRNHSGLASATPKAQGTPDRQATAGAQASATVNANIILSDTLSQNTNQWPVGSQGWYSCDFKNNAYHITNHDKAKGAPVLLPGKTVNGPFTYTLTMEQIKGDQTATTNLFGMMLYATVQNIPGKPQVDKFYAFEVLNSSSGQYQFWKYDNSKNASSPWTQLWTKNFGKEFKQGSGSSHVNTVKVIATGKMFTFIVNNKKVGTWKDHSFSSGSVGMLVNLNGAEVAFSNLLLTYS